MQKNCTVKWIRDTGGVSDTVVITHAQFAMHFRLINGVVEVVRKSDFSKQRGIVSIPDRIFDHAKAIAGTELRKNRQGKINFS